jgi:hypothetical protein
VVTGLAGTRSPQQRTKYRALWFVLPSLVVGCGLVGWGLFPPPEAAPLPAPFTVAPGSPQGLEDPSGNTPASSAMGANMLLIPSLSVYAPLVPGGITASGGGRTLQIPDDPGRLTLFDEGAAVCDRAGTVLVAGHVSSHGVHGALWPLSRIAPRAAVYLTCTDGSVVEWEVVAVHVNPKADLPQDIFTSTGTVRAEIITCGGPVMPDGHYRDNVRVELARVGTAESPRPPKEGR